MAILRVPNHGSASITSRHESGARRYTRQSPAIFEKRTQYLRARASSRTFLYFANAKLVFGEVESTLHITEVRKMKCFYSGFQFVVFLILALSPTLGLKQFSSSNNDEYRYKISNVTDQNATNCFREHENDKLDIREVLGQWKVLEVYMHLTYEGVKSFPVCPDVKIWETEDFPSTTFGVGS